MKFCENCGEKLEDNQKFCENCGVKVADTGNEAESVKVEDKQDASTVDSTTDNNKEGQNSSTADSINNQTKATHKPISKKFVIAIGALVIIAGGGIFGYQQAKDYYSLDNQVDRYIETLQSRDNGKIASVLSTSEEGLEITKESIAPYVESFLYNVDWNQTRYDLISNRSTETLLLKKEGSNFVLFDNYELELIPAYVTLTTNTTDAKLFIGEDEVATSDSDEFSYQHGAVIPGEHIFSAKVELDGEELVTEDTVTVMSGKDDYPIALDIEGMHFEVSSNVEDAEVYLNDENIGQLADGNGEFGPFGNLEGAVLELRQETSFGEIKTEPVDVSNSDFEYYDLRFADMLTEEDVQAALQRTFDQLSNLTNEYQYSLEADLKEFGQSFSEGVAYDELRPFYVDYAKRQRENEEVQYVEFEVRLSNYEQTAADEYKADIEIDYISHFNGTEANNYVAADDRIRTFAYNATLVSKNVDDGWGDMVKALSISGFANEEMTYDSNAE